MRKVSKVEVRLNGALGHCRCGAQTTKIVAVDGIPNQVALNGKLNIPFCDECFAKSAFRRRAMREDEESRMAESIESQQEQKQQTRRNRL
jgi:hypothetical protein